eukprot:GEZU01015672.1.p1 GENE.GEZU01015672.1~~GEZU01015672.1.p1  ORF type:complete len:151 (-),score=22.72 GEZU01015672.1:90-542(-)
MLSKTTRFTLRLAIQCRSALNSSSSSHCSAPSTTTTAPNNRYTTATVVALRSSSSPFPWEDVTSNRTAVPPELHQKSLQLYRSILKNIRRLPKEAQSYYHCYVKEGFYAHMDEDDPDRIRTMHEQTQQNMQWILAKYGLDIDDDDDDSDK